MQSKKGVDDYGFCYECYYQHCSNHPIQPWSCRKNIEDVKQCGAKVVMKNNAAECVLISPDEYVRLMDELNDARLLAVASERMAHFDPTSLISEEEMNRRLGITEDDLTGFDEVDIE